MHAIQISTFGDPSVLVLAETKTPKPSAQQLLVRVHAAGLNRADLLQRRGHYPAPPGESSILGLEIAGEVVACGDKTCKYQIGDRVFGLVAGGGYAEYCCLEEDLAMKIPECWDYVTAAAVPEVFITANETAFVLGELMPRQSILVHAGGSGVGSACIQMAKYIGAKVFFTAGSEEKIQKILKIGGDAGFNYKSAAFADEILALTNQEGVDVIEDFTGASLFPANLKCLKRKGRLIIVAFMGGAKAEIDLSVVLRKQLQIKGSVLRTRTLAEKSAATLRFSERWLPILMRGLIKPIIDSTFSLSDAAKAHARMEANLNFGKIVLTVCPGPAVQPRDRDDGVSL